MTPDELKKHPAGSKAMTPEDRAKRLVMTPSDSVQFEQACRHLSGAGEGWSEPESHGAGYAKIKHRSGIEVHGNPSSMYCVVKDGRALAADMKAKDAIAVALNHAAASEKLVAEKKAPEPQPATETEPAKPAQHAPPAKQKNRSAGTRKGRNA